MATPENTLLLQLGIVVFVAVILGSLFERVGLPGVLGYASAGYFLGMMYPEGRELISLFAELGIAMLLFYIGMEFNVRKFLQFGVQAIVLSPIKSGVGFLLGFIGATLLGFPMETSIVAGAATAVSSTGIISNTILERRMQHSVEARTALSMLILEDIFSVIFITLLLSRGEDILTAVLHTSMVLILLLTVGIYISRLLFHLAGRYIKPETLVVFSVGALVVFSYGFSLLGIPPTLGAFFAGMSISELTAVPRIERDLEPLKRLFVIVFFTSIGFLYSPLFTFESILLGLLLSIAQLVAVLSASSVMPLLGNSIRSAARFFMLDLPLGEFSLFFAAVAASVGIPRSEEIMGAVFVAIVITNILSNILWKKEVTVVKVFRKYLPLPDTPYVPLYIPREGKSTIPYILALIAIIYLFFWSIEKDNKVLSLIMLVLLLYPISKLLLEIRERISRFLEFRMRYMKYKDTSYKSALLSLLILVLILSLWASIGTTILLQPLSIFLILLAMGVGVYLVRVWSGKER